MMAVAFGSRLDLVTTAARVAHPGLARRARAAAMARSVFGGVAEFRRWAASHCDVARVLGARIGLSGQPLNGQLRIVDGQLAVLVGLSFGLLHQVGIDAVGRSAATRDEQV
jgi:hypothetical protein